jgi:hypothetical protein
VWNDASEKTEAAQREAADEKSDENTMTIKPQGFDTRQGRFTVTIDY